MRKAALVLAAVSSLFMTMPLAVTSAEAQTTVVKHIGPYGTTTTRVIRRRPVYARRCVTSVKTVRGYNGVVRRVVTKRCL